MTSGVLTFLTVQEHNSEHFVGMQHMRRLRAMGPFAKAPDRHGERAIQYVHPDATSRRHIVTPRPAMSGSDATASLADGDAARRGS